MGIYAEAADIIEARGWLQGSFLDNFLGIDVCDAVADDNGSPCCASFALAKAADNDNNLGSDEWFAVWEGALNRWYVKKGFGLVDFNDSRERTQEEVVQALRDFDREVTNDASSGEGA